MKRFFRFILLYPFCLLVLYLLMRGGLNYSGFCWDQKRWLSDEERIHLEILNIVGRTQEYIMDGPDGSRLYDVVPYTSKEEFFKENPKCCSNYNSSIGSWESAFARISGNHSGSVLTIQYKQRILLNGKIIQFPSGPTEYNMKLQTNCGKQFFY